MEFSKKLMLFACGIIAAAFAVAVFSYLQTGGGMEYIMQIVMWLGAPVVAYMAKSAYENKAKIETEYLEKKNADKSKSKS